jgi:hypothetical protein
MLGDIAMAKAQCSGCHATFTRTKAFELHRVGSYDPPQRCCLTEAEMRAKGMTQNSKGWWMTPASSNVPFWAQSSPDEDEGAEEEEIA